MMTSHEIAATLDEMIASAERKIRSDEAYWMVAETGQDTEEAEESGRLLGYLEGLRRARALVEA